MRFSKFFSCRIFLFYLFLLFAFVSSVSAAELKLGWWPNTEPDLQGYKIYYGVESGNYTNVVDFGDPLPINGIIIVVLSDLSPFSTYYLSVKAYNDKGLSSNFSPEIVWSYKSHIVGSGSADLEVFVNKNYADDGLNDCFYTVAQGYDSVEDLGTVFICVDEYFEDLYLDLDKRVILSGGWVVDDGDNISPDSNICGCVIISKGTVVMDGVVITGTGMGVKSLSLTR